MTSKTCAYCGKPIKKTNKYCNQSCAAKANNSLQGLCAECGTIIPKANKYCINCRELGIKKAINKRSDWIYNTTIKDILNRNTKQPANNYRQIRDHARYMYTKSDRPQECKICGYTTHFDVCHIKSIKDFEEGTLISEVNSPENLIALCKNHHWELDNGYLTL